MRKAFKYRVYLTNGQRRILEQQLEECRWVYIQMRRSISCNVVSKHSIFDIVGWGGIPLKPKPSDLGAVTVEKSPTFAR